MVIVTAHTKLYRVCCHVLSIYRINGIGDTIISSESSPKCHWLYGTVKYRMSSSSVGIKCEITDTLELIMTANLCILGEERLYLYSIDNFQRIGIEHLTEVAVLFLSRVFHREKSVVETSFGIYGMCGRHPMECTP